MTKQTLTLPQERWFWMTPEQKKEMESRYTVKVGLNFKSAEDLDQLREMAPVARAEVQHV